MSKVVILHGTNGSSQGSWKKWLKDQLEAAGHEVWLPDLPRADYPSLQEWSEFVIKQCPFDIDSSTILVGHSAGAVAVLIVAQKLNTQLRQVVSVASFKDLSYLHEKLDWHANDRFFDVEFDFGKIKHNCSDIKFVHSDDDPYCPQEQAKYLAEKTNGQYILIPKSGHFNTEYSDKFMEFPELLDIINE